MYPQPVYRGFPPARSASRRPEPRRVRIRKRWAIEDSTDCSRYHEDLLPKEEMAFRYPFELDDFQKRAILHVENKVTYKRSYSKTA